MKRFLIALIAAGLMLIPRVARADDGLQLNGLGMPKKEEKVHHDFVNTNAWEIHGDAASSSITGKLVVSCFTDDLDEFKMSLKGLKPNAVYTVWLATSLKETAGRAGVGAPPFKIKTGGGDSVSYQVPLHTCPLTEYRWLEIRYHPDGDPTHLDNSERVVKLRLLAQ